MKTDYLCGANIMDGQAYNTTFNGNNNVSSSETNIFNSMYLTLERYFVANEGVDICAMLLDYNIFVLEDDEITSNAVFSVYKGRKMFILNVFNNKRTKILTLAYLFAHYLTNKDDIDKQKKYWYEFDLLKVDKLCKNIKKLAIDLLVPPTKLVELWNKERNSFIIANNYKDDFTKFASRYFAIDECYIRQVIIEKELLKQIES